MFLNNLDYLINNAINNITKQTKSVINLIAIAFIHTHTIGIGI